MVVFDSVKSINAYPIPAATIQTAAALRGVDLQAESTTEILKSSEYRLLFADVLMYLADSPTVSQGGQNYSFTDEQRKQFRERAAEIYDELADDTVKKVVYGYKGSKL